MASELRVNTLKDASGNNSVGMEYVAEGTAKSWMNLNGSSFGLRDSFNVASATDVSTGKYTANFTSSMNTANYAVLTNGSRANDATVTARQSELATGSYTPQCFEADTPSSAFEDSDSVYTTVIGDLA